MAAPLSFSTYPVIDLTGDDEVVGSSIARTVVQSSNNTTAGNVRNNNGSVLISSHGLPDPDEFASRRAPAKTTIYDGQRRGSGTGIGIPGSQQFYAPIVPGATLQSYRDRTPSSRPEPTHEDEAGCNSHSDRSSNAFQLPGRKRQRLNPEESQVPSSSQSPMFAARSQVRQVSRLAVHAPAPSPTATIITGESRAASSVPLETPQNAYRQIEAERRLKEKNHHRMLDAQVIPHVMKAVLGYLGQLPKKQLDEIGSQVAKNGVQDPGFKRNLLANQGMLSPDFERWFARKVQSDIDEEVRVAKSHEHQKTVAPVEDVVLTNAEANHTSPVSADSPDLEMIFENVQEHKTRQDRLRDDSSPATSFSNDQASRNLSESEEKPQHDSGRITRGVAKADYYSFKKTRRRRTTQQDEPQTASKESTPKPIVQRRAPPKIKVKERVPGPRPIRISAIDVKAQLSLNLMCRQRELHGMIPSNIRVGNVSFKTMATNALEDSMVPECQWASQSSDAVTITWTGPDTFVSGALTHYDVFNMQYNRYGNLVVGSTTSKEVKMVDGHRTVRPLVTEEENKENSSSAMRATQDPWRYASVVSTAHLADKGFTFSASYDKSVKIWKVKAPVKGEGISMELHGTWEHDVLVNFVVTSPYHNKVATACESAVDAVRVYEFEENDVALSNYDVYNADRSRNRPGPGDLRMAEKWAYHPATMQWGRAERVANLLLVGYSPRGEVVHDEAIPDTKKNSGELCCWNVTTREQVSISAGHSQNVFEVIWHPTQPVFLVASAPSGTYDTKTTKTQIRLFALHGSYEEESFTCLKTFDCPAADINELTMMPRTFVDGYITASCTNGSTYVWDTMREHEPIHILEHGESIDNPDPNLPIEQADSGVKFACWGQSPNRFYTGSSDGVVKAWDVTKPKSEVLVRNILEAPGGIACGVFSEDYTQLLIGDATGHLHLIRAPDPDEPVNQTPLALAMARRKLIIPHADPLPPDHLRLAPTRELSYIERDVLRKYSIPGIPDRKQICQGANYEELGLYRDELHVDGDHTKPLLPNVAKEKDFTRDTDMMDIPKRIETPILPPRNSRPYQNIPSVDLDLDISSLLLTDSPVEDELRRDLDISADWGHSLEIVDEGEDFSWDHVIWEKVFS